jgi:sugar phosphate isomerase/epimerase
MPAPSRLFVSTACVARHFSSLGEQLKAFAAAGLQNIEFGHCPPLAGWSIESGLATYRGRALLHNYFPPPSKPFVLNLASQDSAVLEQSITLAEDALRISGELGAPYYSVHSGFLAELSAEQLGGRLDHGNPVDYAAGYATFCASIRQLLAAAKRAGVTLLVEPNVVAPFNLREGRNPFLMLAEPEEFRRLFRDLPDPALGVLLDTGHLQVTAKTLGFAIEDFVEAVGDRIGGFHLHDNDGTADQHRPVTLGSWALALICSANHTSKPVTIESSFSGVAQLEQNHRMLETVLSA